MTRVIEDAASLRAACDEFRSAGRRVGLVPTMGALHDGHLSLIDAARDRGAGALVVSIFVNPTQFGPGEDYEHYPRTFEQDLSACRTREVALVYAPAASAMYPPGFQTHVEVEHTTERFEGAIRPTHFRGVTTVVTKLFNAVGPCIATFGRKDYQQWRTLARMARDLDMPVEVVGCPIVREPDGLAMSSRNRYLDADQRARAVSLSSGLRAASTAFREGERSLARLEQLARAPIDGAADAVDYAAVVDADDLSQPGEAVTGRLVLLVAARLGGTRLLDNAVLGEELC